MWCTQQKYGLFPASALDLLVISVFRNHQKVVQCLPESSQMMFSQRNKPTVGWFGFLVLGAPICLIYSDETWVLGPTARGHAELSTKKNPHIHSGMRHATCIRTMAHEKKCQSTADLASCVSFVIQLVWLWQLEVPPLDIVRPNSPFCGKTWWQSNLNGSIMIHIIHVALHAMKIIYLGGISHYQTHK